MPMPANNLVECWDSSYARNENNVLEPYEELVKFMSRFVFDRESDTGTIELKGQFKGKVISDLRVVDIGCGIGAQSQYLAQMGFTVNGFDISHVAISRAKKRLNILGLDASASFEVVSPDRALIEEYFDIGIACASLDSMPYSCAVDWLKSAGEKCNADGLFFATLIGPSAIGRPVKEEVVANNSYEAGTVQSYFDRTKIEDLFECGGFEIQRMDFVSTETLFPSSLKMRSSGRFSVVAKKLFRDVLAARAPKTHESCVLRSEYEGGYPGGCRLQ